MESTKHRFFSKSTIKHFLEDNNFSCISVGDYVEVIDKESFYFGRVGCIKAPLHETIIRLDGKPSIVTYFAIQFALDYKNEEGNSVLSNESLGFHQILPISQTLDIRKGGKDE